MTQDEALALLKTGASIFLTGQPGSGKTHTLSRLRAAANGRIVPTPIFSYVRLTTSPNMIRRHLRQELARDLVKAWGDRALTVIELEERIATAAEKAPTEDPQIQALRKAIAHASNCCLAS